MTESHGTEGQVILHHARIREQPIWVGEVVYCEPRATLLFELLILRVLHRSWGDGKIPTMLEKRRKKLDPRKSSSCARKTRVQSKTEGRPKKLRPGNPLYQQSKQKRRQEKLGASQDKSKLSHGHD